jgi:hypothetical protein
MAPQLSWNGSSDDFAPDDGKYWFLMLSLAFLPATYAFWTFVYGVCRCCVYPEEKGVCWQTCPRRVGPCIGGAAAVCCCCCCCCKTGAAAIVAGTAGSTANANPECGCKCTKARRHEQFSVPEKLFFFIGTLGCAFLVVLFLGYGMGATADLNNIVVGQTSTITKAKILLSDTTTTFQNIDQRAQTFSTIARQHIPSMRGLVAGAGPGTQSLPLIFRDARLQPLNIRSKLGLPFETSSNCSLCSNLTTRCAEVDAEFQSAFTLLQQYEAYTLQVQDHIADSSSQQQIYTGSSLFVDGFGSFMQTYQQRVNPLSDSITLLGRIAPSVASYTLLITFWPLVALIAICVGAICRSYSAFKCASIATFFAMYLFSAWLCFLIPASVYADDACIRLSRQEAQMLSNSDATSLTLAACVRNTSLVQQFQAAQSIAFVDVLRQPSAATFPNASLIDALPKYSALYRDIMTSTGTMQDIALAQNFSATFGVLFRQLNASYTNTTLLQGPLNQLVLSGSAFKETDFMCANLGPRYLDVRTESCDDGVEALQVVATSFLLLIVFLLPTLCCTENVAPRWNNTNHPWYSDEVAQGTAKLKQENQALFSAFNNDPGRKVHCIDRLGLNRMDSIMAHYMLGFTIICLSFIFLIDTPERTSVSVRTALFITFVLTYTFHALLVWSRYLLAVLRLHEGYTPDDVFREFFFVDVDDIRDTAEAAAPSKERFSMPSADYIRNAKLKKQSDSDSCCTKCSQSFKYGRFRKLFFYLPLAIEFLQVVSLASQPLQEQSDDNGDSTIIHSLISLMVTFSNVLPFDVIFWLVYVGSAIIVLLSMFSFLYPILAGHIWGLGLARLWVRAGHLAYLDVYGPDRTPNCIARLLRRPSRWIMNTWVQLVAYWCRPSNQQQNRPQCFKYWCWPCCHCTCLSFKTQSKIARTCQSQLNAATLARKLFQFLPLIYTVLWIPVLNTMWTGLHCNDWDNCWLTRNELEDRRVAIAGLWLGGFYMIGLFGVAWSGFLRTVSHLQWRNGNEFPHVQNPDQFLPAATNLTNPVFELRRRSLHFLLVVLGPDTLPLVPRAVLYLVILLLQLGAIKRTRMAMMDGWTSFLDMHWAWSADNPPYPRNIAASSFLLLMSTLFNIALMIVTVALLSGRIGMYDIVVSVYTFVVVVVGMILIYRAMWTQGAKPVAIAAAVEARKCTAGLPRAEQKRLDLRGLMEMPLPVGVTTFAESKETLRDDAQGTTSSMVDVTCTNDEADESQIDSDYNCRSEQGVGVGVDVGITEQDSVAEPASDHVVESGSGHDFPDPNAQLPDGWKYCVDEKTGMPFYQNEVTQEAVWHADDAYARETQRKVSVATDPRS